MPVHKNYEAYELQFCRVIALDHLHSEEDQWLTLAIGEPSCHVASMVAS